jgi:hypothetical protein
VEKSKISQQQLGGGSYWDWHQMAWGQKLRGWGFPKEGSLSPNFDTRFSFTRASGRKRAESNKVACSRSHCWFYPWWCQCYLPFGTPLISSYIMNCDRIQSPS